MGLGEESRGVSLHGSSHGQRLGEERDKMVEMVHVVGSSGNPDSLHKLRYRCGVLFYINMSTCRYSFDVPQW